MLSHAVTDHRAWTAANVGNLAGWYHALPAECLRALGRLREHIADPASNLTDLRLSNDEHAACTTALAPVRAALERETGFAVVHGPPDGLLPAREAVALYWIVGLGLGVPFAQNVQGTLLYDVRDTGQDLSQGARFSVTSYESSFHTDNSFGAEVLDYVGLLCQHNARSGGRSQVLSGFALHNALLARRPEVLETLYRPFHVDRRGGVRPGETPTAQVPVIAWDGRELLFRYLRYWIEAGHDKAAEPLTAAQRSALDVLDEFARRPELRAEFDLQPGQMFFLNNRWLLHNRTAFEDHAEPERRRHLVRLWLRAESIRA
jgi:alpha-ketoglutarate-dependent taurine dioxygenase